MTGQTIGHYRVLDRLGEGGMGIVYKAQDTRLDRLVALKLLPAEKMVDPDRKRRFVLEAKAASALNHPHIATIYDVDHSGGHDFIAMEYVPGSTLDELIRRKPLPLNTALKYAIQIADALAAAHAAGVVHRDLKPANVMITDNGVAKLLDFGLAKLIEPPTAAPSDATQSLTARTATGVVVGTAAYMSPEQAEGKPVDSRSDIFSFGTLLYELTTGRKPFQGDTMLATMAAVAQQDPPRPAGVPPDLEKLILRCLRKDPGRRMQHMGDVRLVLEDLKQESDSGAPAVLGVPRRRFPVLPALAGLALLAAGIAWVWSTRSDGSAPLVPQYLTTSPGNETQPSLSPDGNQVAYVWDGEQQDNLDIYVKLIGAEKPLRLTSDAAGDVSPAWSPDGRSIAFLRRQSQGERKSSIHLVPALGGAERLVTELRFPLPGNNYDPWPAGPYPLLAWTRDGKALLYTDRDSPQEPIAIFEIELEAGARRRLTRPPSGMRGDGASALSPDGNWLCFSRSPTITRSQLFRMRLDANRKPAGEPELLVPTSAWDATPVFLDEGREILFSRGTMFAGPYSLWRTPFAPGAAPQRLSLSGESGWPAYSAARSRLVFSQSSTDENIWLVPLRDVLPSGPSRKLIASTRNDGVPQFSPDGKRIVFTSDRSGAHEVWACDRDGADLVQLTSMRAGMTGSPHWSPDGSHIVFDSNKEGQFDVYVIRSAGGSPRRLTDHPRDDAVASYSPDGKWIYFGSGRSGRTEVWKMPVEGGPPEQITRGGGRSPQATADGRAVYFEKGPNEGYWRIDPAGGKEEKILPSVSFLRAHLTSRGIYFSPQDPHDGPPGLYFYSFASRSARLLLPVTVRLSTGLTVSPDGTPLLYTQADQAGSDLMLVENFR